MFYGVWRGDSSTFWRGLLGDIADTNSQDITGNSVCFSDIDNCNIYWLTRLGVTAQLMYTSDRYGVTEDHVVERRGDKGMTETNIIV